MENAWSGGAAQEPIHQQTRHTYLGGTATCQLLLSPEKAQPATTTENADVVDLEGCGELFDTGQHCHLPLVPLEGERHHCSGLTRRLVHMKTVPATKNKCRPGFEGQQERLRSSGLHGQLYTFGCGWLPLRPSTLTVKYNEATSLSSNKKCLRLWSALTAHRVHRKHSHTEVTGDADFIVLK